jgi:hypothetical protein
MMSTFGTRRRRITVRQARVNSRSILHRIATLERHAMRVDDATILALGRTVTDDELRALATDSGVPDGAKSSSERVTACHAGVMSDAELFGTIRPAIDELRRREQ